MADVDWWFIQNNIGPTMVFAEAIISEVRGYDIRLYMVPAINSKKTFSLHCYTKMSTAVSYLILLSMLDQHISPQIDCPVN